MVCFPLLWLEEAVAFVCCAVAAIVTAGRPAATAMLALAVKNLRRDVTSSIEVVISFIGSSPICGQDVHVTQRQSILRRSSPERDRIRRCLHRLLPGTHPAHRCLAAPGPSAHALS